MKYIIIIIVILLCILIAYLLTHMELHYWNLDKDGLSILISIGSYVFRLGKTP